MKKQILSISVLFWAGIPLCAKATPYLPVSGKCNLTKKEIIAQCEKPEKQTIYSLNPKASKAVMTQASACSESEKSLSMDAHQIAIEKELPDSGKLGEGGTSPKTKLAIQSCTVLTNPGKSEKSIILQTKDGLKPLDKPSNEMLDERPTERTEYIFLAHLKDGKISASTNLQSRITITDNKHELTISSICDENDDGLADLVIHGNYYLTKRLLLHLFHPETGITSETKSLPIQEDCGGC